MIDGNRALPTEIAGRDVRLRRPRPRTDAAHLFPATHGSAEAEAVWSHMGYGPWSDSAAMEEWIVATVASEDPHWWTVERIADGLPVGMVSILAHDRDHRRAEVGHIWYVPAAQRTTANTESAYLLLVTCFDDLECRRVEWKCDSRNRRSRDAAVRLGFVFEGVFRNHMLVKGENRDTAWHSMTDDDWERQQPRIARWLYESPRDEQGRPVAPLQSGS